MLRDINGHIQKAPECVHLGGAMSQSLGRVANCDTIHLFFELKPDFVMVSQILSVHESCSGLRCVL